jgi:hypothetical protein
MQTVVETPDFLRDARAAGMGDGERRSIVDHAAANPTAGDLIVGSGGARKIRFAAPGRGKSGGDRVNLSRAEINELREELSHLANEYREGMSRHVKGR